jgi:hypothetical protein
MYVAISIRPRRPSPRFTGCYYTRVTARRLSGGFIGQCVYPALVLHGPEAWIDKVDAASWVDPLACRRISIGPHRGSVSSMSETSSEEHLSLSATAVAPAPWATFNRLFVLRSYLTLVDWYDW